MASGELIWWPGASAPSGWLICDGSFVSQATYAALFAVLGHAFNGGTDPGDGTFRLPEFKGRMHLGQAAAGIGSTLGETGGPSPSGLPSHQHAQPDHTHAVTQPDAHGSHTIGQATAHSLAHSGSAVADHAALTHAAPTMPAHSVGQPSAHSTHSTASTHTHDSHTGGNTGLAGTFARTTSPATHNALGGHDHSSVNNHTHSGQTTSAHSASANHADHAAQSHSVTEMDAHSLAHSGAALDAHSAHIGFSTLGDGGALVDAADVPYLALHRIVRT